MARKVQVHLLDDIDGTPAEETVRFGLDGTFYEIDLSTRHAGATATGGRTRGQAPARPAREQNQAIRDWAKSKGLDVNDRGRIPASIVEQYHATAGR